MSIRRPTSVTIVAVIIIIATVVSSALLIVFMSIPSIAYQFQLIGYSQSMLIAMSIITLGFGLVSGIGLLNGQNWARLLYLIGSPFSMALGIATTPSEFLGRSIIQTSISAVVYLVFLFILVRPAASAYFMSHATVSSPHQTDTRPTRTIESPESPLISPTVPDLTCESCRAPVIEGQQYCSSCGEPIGPTLKADKLILCHKCHAVINEGDSYCGKCGTKLR